MKRILEIINQGKEVFLNNLEFTIRIIKNQNSYKLTSYDKEIKEKEISYINEKELENFLKNNSNNFHFFS